MAAVSAYQAWPSALVDLITILGDGDENYDRIDCFHADQVAAMRRNWREGAASMEPFIVRPARA